jgi:hypothetical protein
MMIRKEIDMNKREAKRYARRLVVGYIDGQFYNEKHPLCYDEYSPDSIKGRRLSKGDFDRVCMVMDDLYVNIAPAGYDSENHYLADGKPGAKWGKFKQWLKKQGRFC